MSNINYGKLAVIGVVGAGIAYALWRSSQKKDTGKLLP